MKFVAFLVASIPLTCMAAEVPQQPIVQQGTELLDDSFERSELGEWKTVIPTFTVRDGVLKGEQTRDDHGAVGRIHRPMKNVVVEFRFFLDGSTGFNAVFDDQKFKGSHAGHICRVAITAKQIRLGDDKEGVMRNDIFEMRKDATRKKEADKLLLGRSFSAPVEVKQRVWHELRIEIMDDRLRVSLNGKGVGYLQSPGIGHATKSSFHFTVNGPGVFFDDVRISDAL